MAEMLQESISSEVVTCKIHSLDKSSRVNRQLGTEGKGRA